MRDMAYLDTHYYGGIKKYQWVALPLAHARRGLPARTAAPWPISASVKRTTIRCSCMSDLLVHLAARTRCPKICQATVVEGDSLDGLIAGGPLAEDESLTKGEKERGQGQRAEAAGGYLSALQEEDFASAELEIVPAGKARDMRPGPQHDFLGYGQDDRVCALHLSMAADAGLARARPSTPPCCHAGR